MTDPILKELWNIKDDIAKEHNYDIDRLASYLQLKSQSGKGYIFQNIQKEQPQPNVPAAAQPPRR